MSKNKVKKSSSGSKIKGEVTLTVVYENDREFYPEGSTPEECLEIDLKNFREDPEMLIMYKNGKISGRLLE